MKNPGILAAVLTGVAAIFVYGVTSCTSVLPNIPPNSTVCVELSVFGVTVKECGTNNTPVSELKERAYQKALRKAGAVRIVEDAGMSDADTRG